MTMNIKPIEQCEFWTFVSYNGHIWQLTDKEHKSDHVTLRRRIEQGTKIDAYAYVKLPFGHHVISDIN